MKIRINHDAIDFDIEYNISSQPAFANPMKDEVWFEMTEVKIGEYEVYDILKERVLHSLEDQIRIHHLLEA